LEVVRSRVAKNLFTTKGSVWTTARIRPELKAKRLSQIRTHPIPTTKQTTAAVAPAYNGSRQPHRNRNDPNPHPRHHRYIYSYCLLNAMIKMYKHVFGRYRLPQLSQKDCCEANTKHSKAPKQAVAKGRRKRQRKRQRQRQRRRSSSLEGRP